ncbi:hypothetical protein FQR65_LT05659 [Abscondita terminalis]|nr:hypothetical protein FQR65_LT05659 [Abscondita terminalis]
MKILIGVLTLFCMGIINAIPNPILENCIKSTGVDEKSMRDFRRWSKNDCDGIEACLKCILDEKGIVQNGAVNVSSLQKYAKDNAEGRKQLTICEGMSATDICGLSKCVRAVMLSSYIH